MRLKLYCKNLVFISIVNFHAASLTGLLLLYVFVSTRDGFTSAQHTAGPATVMILESFPSHYAAVACCLGLDPQPNLARHDDAF